jgi:hypothetical protein
MVADNELGTIQLSCVFPDAWPLADGPYATILRVGALHEFLDFVNFLIFGVEASRNNLVMLTGLLSLLRMRYGSFRRDKEANSTGVTYDDLLDLFPLAINGTGPGNFVMDNAVLSATRMAEANAVSFQQANKRPIGFSIVRDNSKWLAIPLRSCLLIYTEIADRGLLEDAHTRTRKEFLDGIQELLYPADLLPGYGDED